MAKRTNNTVLTIPKIIKKVLRNQSNTVTQFIINKREIHEANIQLENHGLEFPPIVDFTEIHATNSLFGTYYFSKTYIKGLFNAFIDWASPISGIWIWLIEDTNSIILEKKLLISRAGVQNREQLIHRIIPDFNKTYDIHQNVGREILFGGRLDNYYSATDLVWKRNNINSTRFGVLGGEYAPVKGFFIGRRVLLNAISDERVNGIQIELLFNRQNYPTLCFYKLTNRNELINLGATLYTNPTEIRVEEGVAIAPTGSACSRPSPPYGE